MDLSYNLVYQLVAAFLSDIMNDQLGAAFSPSRGYRNLITHEELVGV
jgi:hypothetical protein